MEETHVVTCFLRHGAELLLLRRSDEVGSYPLALAADRADVPLVAVCARDKIGHRGGGGTRRHPPSTTATAA